MQLPTLLRRTAKPASAKLAGGEARPTLWRRAPVPVSPVSPRASEVSSCHDRATRLVHKYAIFGAVWALLPVPMATSAGLALLETHLIYWIARIYGESPTKADIFMTAAGLELASVALKTVAVEGAALVPVVGLGVKASIAGSVVEAIGHTIVRHYEAKHAA